MKFKASEIIDVKILKGDKVILEGEMYNKNSTKREIELAKQVRELEKKLKKKNKKG